MDEVLFEDDNRKLKISVAGIESASGTVDAENFRLTVFAFESTPTVKPLFTAELNVEQAAELHAYLSSISLVRDHSRKVSGRFIELDSTVSKDTLQAFLDHPDLKGNPDVVRAILSMNPELSRAIMETELTAVDVQSLAYRRAQLTKMRQMLDDPEYFGELREERNNCGKEAVWQKFFESNQWIFGLALHYVIGEGVKADRLEQVVAGHSIAGTGKRTDALLRTRGILKSLCYVEIKTHETTLVHSTPYRSEVWRPSDELAGAVAQSQKTVQLAMEELKTKLNIPFGGSREDGDLFFNYSPRSLVVCGSLNEFETADGINEPMFASFELFRRNVHAPDVITFDELYERAVAVVEAGFDARQSQCGHSSGDRIG